MLIISIGLIQKTYANYYPNPTALSTNGFNHPGILSTKADLDLIKNNQTTEPWKSALDALKATPTGSLTYSMQGPYSEIYRGSDNTTGWTQHGKDAQACYVQSLLWYITGNSTYATNAINIINAWSSTLTSVGGADVELLVGIQSPLWAMAGEILANSGIDSGWASADITSAKNMLTNIFLPAIVGFSSADGANFSTSCMFATMAIAVFTDNQTKFDEVWSAFISTDGCPNDFSLFKNIASNGQNVESGRDQIHSWSSYEMLSGLAEIAYNQGYDPYTLGSNRLMTGVEYWCKYNLGNTVPYDTSVYRCRAGWGPWSQISSTGRGLPTEQGSVTNMVYRAYKRLGLTAPYTKQVTDAMGNTIVPPNSRNGWGNPFIADCLLYIQPTTSTTSNLNPIADTYVNGGASTTNYGTATSMVTKTSTTDRYAYLKFDLSGVSGSITSAKLKLFTKSVSSASTRSVYALSDDSWSETNLTWNNKPSYGNELSNINITSTGSYVEWDVTSYINSEYTGDKTASLCINDPVSSNNTGIDFYSKENGSNIPILTIITETPSGQSVSLSTTSGDDYVNLSWALINITLGHQDIFRDTDPDPSGRIMIAGSVSGNNYTDNAVTSGTTYYYWIKATDASGAIINSDAISATTTGCIPSTITPYLQIDGGSWSQASTATINAGQTIKFGPQPTTGGTWSWSGPNDYSATTREITLSNIQSSQSGDYIATYTNSNGCESTRTFTIDVISTLTIQENETGFCSVDGTVDTNHSGYTGTGFSNTANASDNGISWSVNIPSNGSYILKWRYASTSNRSARLKIDGITVVSSFDFPSTGSWSTWTETSEINVSLSAGTRAIRIEGIEASALANIDYISITGINPTPISCIGSTLKSATNKTLPVTDNHIENNTLTIHPNPSKENKLNLKFELAKGFQNITADLYSITGKQIKHLNLGNAEAGTFNRKVELLGIEKGMYFIKIQLENTIITKKLLIE